VAIDQPPTPTTRYGIRIEVEPDNSGANPASAYTVLSRSDTSGGTYKTVAVQKGSSKWEFEDEMPSSAGRKYYKAQTTHLGTGWADSSLIGPIDAKPGDLGIRLD
jgi:hypothetical protein